MRSRSGSISLLAASLALCCVRAALAQPAPTPPRAFVDEAVNARDVLIRVEELRGSGNLTEATRVVQELLEDDADHLLASTNDRELFVTVRAHAHRLLLDHPDLLEKYRLEHEPRANELVALDRNEEALRTHFLTASGFEAGLRFAQAQMESARFESARLTLLEVASHPDCANLRAADAARLAGELHAYLPREDVRSLASRLAERGQVDADALLLPQAPPPPAQLLVSRTCFDAMAQPEWKELSAQPLQSVTYLHTPEHDDRAPWQRVSDDLIAWTSPCIAGEAAYVCDELGFSAFDAATLATLWRLVPGEVSGFTPPNRNELGFFGAGMRAPEDLSSPASTRGVVVGVTGMPVGGMRIGDGRVHALRASDGALLWSVEAQYLDPRLEGGSVRGAPVIEGDTVVLGVRKSGLSRRVTALYMIGLDLFTGELRWVRLVGSGGAPVFGRAQGRPDATLLHEGIVYRADDVGVVAALDASTGTPIWVRTLPGRQPMDTFSGFGAVEPRLAFEAHQPVLKGESLFVIIPELSDVLELDARTGAVMSRRAGTELGDPSYLLAAGSNLACVSRTGVAFVEFADLAGGTVTRLSATGGQGPFRTVGRAVVMDGSLCVPVDDGLVIVPPGANAPTRLHTMERSGNVVTPPGSSRAGELVGHALVADSQGVHTFLSWDRAKTTLEARVTRAPRDPVPLLTYLQLALRQGKSELAPDLTDRTLALIDADRQSATSEKARGDLFALLHRALAASQRALDPLSRAPDEENTTFEFPPVRDGTLLNALSDRLMRVAETPAQRAVALFDRAFLLEFQQRPGGAVEALQEVLADESLATLSMRELGLSDTRADALAGETATQKLGALLTVTGPEPYAPYEEEAMHAASLLPLTARYDDISNLARRYPASSSAPALWVRASDAAIKEGSPARAREVLARGVDSVLLLRRIGRDANAADVSRLAGGLLSNADKGADLEPSLLLLVALEREFPGSSATTPSGTTTLASAVQSLRSRLASREGRFSIGDATSGRVVALEGWQPLTPLSDGRAGDATSLAPMVSRAGDRVALFAPSLADGRLVMLWSRAVDILPTVVQLTPERTLLYHPKTSSPVLEGVSHDGTTLWKTPSLRDLFDQASGAPALGSAPERINTPLDGMVRRDDVLFALDGATLVVGERAGRVVALDTGTGKPVWGSAPPLTRLFDIDARAGRVLVVGAMEGAEEGEDPRPVVLTLDLSTGVMVWTAPGDTLDEHARWGLLLSDADAVLGTSHRVTRLNARTGEAVWSNTRGELRDTGGGWLVGSSLFVLDDNFELRRLALASGEGARDGLNDQGRLKLPFEVYTTNTTLTLSSEAGLIVFDEQGAVAGIDAVQTPGDLVPALLGAERMVTLQFLPREENAQRITMGVPARVLIFSHPDGRLLSERAINLVTRPDALRAVDGKLLIDQGVCTTVVDIPFAVP